MIIEDSKYDETQLQNIETFLHKQLNIPNPTLLIEFISENPRNKIDADDFISICKKFGELKFIEIDDKITVIQFHTFFSAYSFKKFFEDPKNLEQKNIKIKVRFFENSDEEAIKEIIDKKKKKISEDKIVENVNKVMINNYLQKYDKLEKNWENNYKNKCDIDEEELENIEENPKTNAILDFDYCSTLSLSKKGQSEFNQIVNLNKIRGLQNIENSINLSSNNNSSTLNNEKTMSKTKFVCKFFLQTENEKDKDFQILRRIIGAKGTNLKRIMDYCSRGPNGVYIPNAIKLRLRGKGSGYVSRYDDKVEPLNLCVTSMYQDKYKKACSFVGELIINVYEEYKRFCARKGKVPNGNLTIEKLEYINRKDNKK